MNVSNRDKAEWTRSVYYAHTQIDCALEKVWPRMLEYWQWNPTFKGVQLNTIRGERGREGEVVLIRKDGEWNGEPFPQFYAETVKLIPPRRVVWYMYLKEGHKYCQQEDSIRNFADFSLTELPSGVRFDIAYYAQNLATASLLAIERKSMEGLLPELAAALKSYCEGSA